MNGYGFIAPQDVASLIDLALLLFIALMAFTIALVLKYLTKPSR